MSGSFLLVAHQRSPDCDGVQVCLLYLSVGFTCDGKFLPIRTRDRSSATDEELQLSRPVREK